VLTTSKDTSDASASIGSALGPSREESVPSRKGELVVDVGIAEVVVDKVVVVVIGWVVVVVDVVVVVVVDVVVVVEAVVLEKGASRSASVVDRVVDERVTNS